MVIVENERSWGKWNSELNGLAYVNSEFLLTCDLFYKQSIKPFSRSFIVSNNNTTNCFRLFLDVYCNDLAKDPRRVEMDVIYCELNCIRPVTMALYFWAGKDKNHQVTILTI